MYDHILVPTDGSPQAGNAVAHALDLAEQFDSTVHALYVVEVEDVRDRIRGVEGIHDKLTEHGAEAVERVAERGAERGVEVVTAVERGAPHEVIREYAEEHGVDLVVMGTHGRTGVDRALLGSVTERVVRTAPVPVLTVRLGEGEHEVKTAEAAVELAREKLLANGHENPAFPEAPSRQRAAWVVRAETDDGAFNVHVDSATQEAHLVRVDRG
ncbi:MAG: universal stress protein [Halobacteriaceae archaeon]